MKIGCKQPVTVIQREHIVLCVIGGLRGNRVNLHHIKTFFTQAGLALLRIFHPRKKCQDVFVVQSGRLLVHASVVIIGGIYNPFIEALDNVLR